MYGEGDPVRMQLPDVGDGVVDEEARDLGHLVARLPDRTLREVSPQDFEELPVGARVFRTGVHLATIVLDEHGRKAMDPPSDSPG